MRFRIVRHKDVLIFIETERLFGLGISYVDAHLLASLRITPGATIWTRDRKLAAVAGSMGLAAKV